MSTCDYDVQHSLDCACDRGCRFCPVKDEESGQCGVLVLRCSIGCFLYTQRSAPQLGTNVQARCCITWMWEHAGVRRGRQLCVVGVTKIVCMMTLHAGIWPDYKQSADLIQLSANIFADIRITVTTVLPTNKNGVTTPEVVENLHEQVCNAIHSLATQVLSSLSPHRR